MGIDLDEIEVIAADLLGRDVERGAVEALDLRRLAGQEDALDFARDLDVVVEPLLLRQLAVNLRVLQRIGGLVGHRLDQVEIGLAEGLALVAIGQGQDAELLLAVMERHGDVGLGLQRFLAEPGEALVQSRPARRGRPRRSGPPRAMTLVESAGIGLQPQEGLQVLRLARPVGRPRCCRPSARAERCR